MPSSVDTQIDKLSLKIEVKAPSPSQIKRVDEFAKSLDNLNKSLPTSLLNRLDKLSKISINLGNLKYIEKAKSLEAQAQKNDAFSQYKKYFKTSKIKSLKSEQKKFYSLYENKPSISKATPLFNLQYGTPSNITGNNLYDASAIKYNQPTSDNAYKIKQNATEAKKARKEVEKSNKEQIKSASKLGKLFNSIKRIALYRIVRGIIKTISEGIADGVTNLSIFSKEMNKTMSSLATSFQNIHNSVALISQPLLEIIDPIVKDISQNLANVANEISKANAQMKGLANYTKISDKYAKDFAQTMNKGSGFAFDQFSSLSSSAYDMFDKGKVDDADDGVKSIGDTFKEIYDSIKGALKLIVTIVKVVKPIINAVGQVIVLVLEKLSALNDRLNENLEPFQGFINEVATIVGIIIEQMSGIIDDVINILAPIFKMVFDIVQAISPIINELLTVLLQTVGSITSSLANIMPSLTELITDIVEYLAPTLQFVADTIAYLLKLLQPALTLVGNILRVLIDIADVMVDLTTFNIDAIIEDFKRIGEGVKKIVLDYWEDLKQFGKDSLEYFVKFLALIGKSAGQAFDNIYTFFKNQLIGPVKTTLKKVGEWIRDNVFKPIGKFFATIWNGVIEGVEFCINALIKFINNFTKAVSKVWTWAGIPGISSIGEVSLNRVQVAKNGGMFSQGTMFIAGEAGAELVTNMGSGTTGVTNVSQFKQAMIEAIYETGLLTSIEESGNIYMDSEKVGDSVGKTKSLRRQLNRTNPALALK